MTMTKILNHDFVPQDSFNMFRRVANTDLEKQRRRRVARVAELRTQLTNIEAKQLNQENELDHVRKCIQQKKVEKGSIRY